MKMQALITQALAELAEGPEPDGLAREAMAKGRRIRTRRAVLAAGAVAGVTALAVVGTSLVVNQARRDPGPAATTPGPTTLYYSDGKTPMATMTRGAAGWVSAADRPAGLVAYHVLAELKARPEFGGKSWDQLANGAYQVVTTIDKPKQDILESLADPRLPGSVLAGQPDNLQAAAVVVEPGTGRVLAYYGGQSDTGGDYAGWYVDDNGQRAGLGRHPPGSTFWVYVLAEALRQGHSLAEVRKSALLMTFPGRAAVLRNTSTCQQPHGDRDKCTLLGSVISSNNTASYGLTLQTGPGNVLRMARDTGIRSMWTDRGAYVDVSSMADDATGVVPSQFSAEVGIGQYGVTVQDQANAMATIANRGHRADAHFVRSVSSGGRQIYAEALPPADPGGPGDMGLNKEQMDNLWYALGRVTSAAKFDGRFVGTKTGTWQFEDTEYNSHAWVVGFTPQLGVAVWIGNKKAEQPIRTRTGKNIYGAGLPTDVLAGFVKKALADTPKVDVSQPPLVGDVNLGELPPG